MKMRSLVIVVVVAVILFLVYAAYDSYKNPNNSFAENLNALVNGVLSEIGQTSDEATARGGKQEVCGRTNTKQIKQAQISINGGVSWESMYVSNAGRCDYDMPSGLNASNAALIKILLEDGRVQLWYIWGDGEEIVYEGDKDMILDYSNLPSPSGDYPLLTLTEILLTLLLGMAVAGISIVVFYSGRLIKSMEEVRRITERRFFFDQKNTRQKKDIQTLPKGAHGWIEDKALQGFAFRPRIIQNSVVVDDDIGFFAFIDENRKWWVVSLYGPKALLERFENALGRVTRGLAQHSNKAGIRRVVKRARAVRMSMGSVFGEMLDIEARQAAEELGLENFGHPESIYLYYEK